MCALSPLQSRPTPHRKWGLARGASYSYGFFSFEGTNAQRTVVMLRHGALVRAYRLQKCDGRRKKQASRDGAAEIEQPVVVARRPANEHVLKHLLDGMRRTAVANEVGAEFALPCPAEGHVV